MYVGYKFIIVTNYFHLQIRITSLAFYLNTVPFNLCDIINYLIFLALHQHTRYILYKIQRVSAIT